MKYNVGMYGGTFSPIHLGHVNNIIKAFNQCQKLYIVVAESDNSDEIDINIRLSWLKEITKDMENVNVITMNDHSKNKDDTNWEIGRDLILKQTGNLDVVFAGDDYKGKDIWEKLYPNSKIEYLPRDEINISSSMIRDDIFKYYDYLPKCVQEYYIKKVCIIGGESTGKSTLVKKLALVYNTSYVEEAGRFVCEECGGIDNMKPSDYYSILTKQKDLEYQNIKSANKVLFIDTDSLTTLFFYENSFKDTKEYDPDFKNKAKLISDSNNYDLYIFLEPDGVSFVDDGYRLDESERYINNDKLKAIYDKNNIHYHLINGNYEERYEKTKELVNSMMGTRK